MWPWLYPNRITSVLNIKILRDDTWMKISTRWRSVVRHFWVKIISLYVQTPKDASQSRGKITFQKASPQSSPSEWALFWISWADAFINLGLVSIFFNTKGLSTIDVRIITATIKIMSAIIGVLSPEIRNGIIGQQFRFISSQLWFGQGNREITRLDIMADSDRVSFEFSISKKVEKKAKIFQSIVLLGSLSTCGRC